MLNFLTANISPDGLRDHNADKSHVLKPNGIVAQLRSEKLHTSSALLCFYMFPEQIKRLTSRPVFSLLY